MSSFDVIVVGGGGSGLAAGCAVAELGGSVLVLEKQPQLGGTTGIAVGSFTANRTAWQQRAGVEDHLEHHVEDAGKFAATEVEARNNAPLRRYFLSEAANTLDWLQKLGLTFYGPSPEPPNRVPRMHNVVPGAKAYIAALQVRLQQLGGTIQCGCPVVGLLRDGNRVVGVRTQERGQEREYRATRGVVLAAGDYASSRELIAHYKGEQFGAIDGVNPHAHGDGHRLILEAGGQLANMDITYGPELRFVPPSRRPFQQLLPAGRWAGRAMGWVFRLLPQRLRASLIKRLLVTWQHPEDQLFVEGAILINERGERFTNELRSPEREIALANQPNKQGYILLDGRLVQRYSAWPHFISTAPDIAYAYVKDYQRLRPDITVKGNTLEEVANRRGIPAQPLRETVEAFNRHVSGKEQTDPFGRGEGESLEQGPWVLLGPTRAHFTTTEGGAVINEHLQVLTPEGQAIPGLYAVGQNGLGGMVLWGHGLHIAWALTSGRLVGGELMRSLD